MIQPMRVAWFSPLPPVRSGIAAYTAEVVPLLRDAFEIDVYAEANAFDFVWTHQRFPYDLVVYQLGNARCHDYIWGYLVRYPGLVVLHDARLHHARARLLLSSDRADDYRAEFQYGHPAVPRDAAEYAVEGLSGSIYYFWPMLRVPVATARSVAVHNARVARDLSDAYPTAAVETIRMGVPEPFVDPGARAALRRRMGAADDEIVFAAFGKVTPEKRIDAILDTLGGLRADGARVSLMFVGDADDDEGLESRIEHARLDGRVHVMGYVPDEEIGNYLAAADACLCLRWPTALETSASWLRCLAASRPTVISDLAHLADIPSSVALRVDIIDERRSLRDAVRRIAADAELRVALAREGHRYWNANHTLDMMTADYGRLLPAAVSRPAPHVPDLPRHFLAGYAETALDIARQFGLAVDVLDARPDPI
jgi:glycosyltransferase involved in cell wall biosynthesis